MTTYQVDVPMEVVAWQGSCLNCEARYAVLHKDSPDAPRLTTCPFCGHRAVYRTQERPHD